MLWTVSEMISGDGDGAAEASWTEEVPSEASAIGSWAAHWAAARSKAKGARDFAEADRIRDLLLGGPGSRSAIPRRGRKSSNGKRETLSRGSLAA